MAADGALIIKRIKKVTGGGHHGGAWKVAYADFVTAMMAFFLLMWLINTTTPEQKRGIADYFAAQNISKTTSGAGGVLGGIVFGEDGSRAAGSAALVEKMIPKKAQGRFDLEDRRPLARRFDASRRNGRGKPSPQRRRPRASIADGREPHVRAGGDVAAPIDAAIARHRRTLPQHHSWKKRPRG